MNDATLNTKHLYTDGSDGCLKIRSYVLCVVAGPDAGLMRKLESGTLFLGTHENNDIILRDPTVSRYHLELQVRADGIKVTDMDSTNGTYIGSTRLGSVLVRTRSCFRVGGESQIEITPEEERVEVAPFPAHYWGQAYGVSKAMSELFALLNQVAPTDTNVLLQGETGTGKELLAEGIHEKSYRSDGAFVVVDCGAIPRDLLAAELFGHTKGAFTGATTQKRGLLDEASGGTLFLDEIGELSLDLQPKLLRVIEKREIRPIGETRFHKVDVRVIAATNRDLKSMVRSGKFREDLYFRLAVVNAVVPPLRKRPEDIPGLIHIFLEQMNKGDFHLPERIVEQLKHYNWPGNVRELRNVVERGVSLTAEEITRYTDQNQNRNNGFVDGGMPLEVMDLPFKEAKNLLVESFEREYLTQLLLRHRGNISRAAMEAGIDRNYIHRLVKKYNLPVSRR